MTSKSIFDYLRLAPRDPGFLGRRIGSQGEIFYNSTTGSISVFNGSTAGGSELAKTDLSNISNSDFLAKASAAGVSGGGGGNTTVTVSATAPEDPDDGNLWLRTTDDVLLVYKESVAQWLPSSGSLADVATSGAYADLSGTPTLAIVATSGAYADLTGTPTLATVATSGAYADLSGTPAIPSLGAIAFVGTNIDSNDSSEITFTPAVRFNSDITVENNLFSGNITSSSVLVDGDAIITGNLTVNGTTTTINSTTLTVEDKNLELAKGALDADSADGAGITVLGPTIPATLIYSSADDTWNFNKSIKTNVIGDTKGSVFGDDSSKIIDAVENKLYGEFFGNVTGNVTGTITTTEIDSADSSAITVIPSMICNADFTVDNDLTVSSVSNLLGDTFVARTYEEAHVINNPSSLIALNNVDQQRGSVYYLTNLTGNFTADFSNVVLSGTKAVSYAIIIAQGATAYMPTAMQVNGASVSPKWSGGGGTPVGNANYVDIVNVTILINSGSVAQVLASLSPFA